jgi:hypothetical protein
MKITNKHGLSDALYLALTRDRYSGTGEKRDYSVTEILNPPKIIHLTRRHDDEIEQDITDLLFMIRGSAIHAILERATETDASYIILKRTREALETVREKAQEHPTTIDWNYEAQNILNIIDKGNDSPDDMRLDALLKAYSFDKYMVEKRFKYKTKNGFIISGGLDLFDMEDKVLYDYKETSVWTYIYRNRSGSRVDDWTTQLNVYRLFLEKAGYEVDKIKVNLMMRDWSKSKSKFDNNYPDVPIVALDIPLLGLDIVEQMIEDKVEAIERYKDMPDNDIPHCNPQERWESPTTYAVMKKGNKAASKVCFGYNDAKNWIGREAQKLADKKGQPVETMMSIFSIVKREGTPARCLDYCPVAKFCNFYRNLPSNLK